jgi:HTH-type transcriptional regulator / antitoxin HigA
MSFYCSMVGCCCGAGDRYNRRGSFGRKMTLTFNPQTYSSLLSDTLPQVIDTEAEYDRFLAVVEQLHAKKQQRTPEKAALYKLLVVLIETYEEKTYPMPVSPPHQILQHILESSGTSPVDLVGWLGSSEMVNAIVAGECPIEPAQAQLLADRFKVSASLFC